MGKKSDLGDLEPKPFERVITREQIREASRLLVDAGKVLGTWMPFSVIEDPANPTATYDKLERSCFGVWPMTLVFGNKELAYKIWIEGICYNEDKCRKDQIDNDELRGFYDDGEGVTLHSDISDDFLNFLKNRPKCDCYRCKGDNGDKG